MGVLYLVELEFGDVGFCRGRKTRASREKLLGRDENRQQMQPTYKAPVGSILSGKAKGKSIKCLFAFGVKGGKGRTRSSLKYVTEPTQVMVRGSSHKKLCIP